MPGADFYIVDDELPNPVGYVEIKSVTGGAPFDISLTRAEYLRATWCAAAGIPYRLILVNVATVELYEIENFAAALNALKMSEAIQITMRVVQRPTTLAV